MFSKLNHTTIKNGITVVYSLVNNEAVKFLKPILIILTIVALTYTVSASKVSFNKLTSTTEVSKNQTTSPSLPVNGDLLFAFTAIASLGGYLALKK